VVNCQHSRQLDKSPRNKYRKLKFVNEN